jgi:hypothetical protein
MNYVFSHFGKEPPYLKTFLNSILSVDNNAKIFFISDYELKIEKINLVNLNEFESLKQKFEELKFLTKSTQIDNNPLWVTSLMRVYAVQKVVDYFNLKEFVHFDTDIIIYESFEEINSYNSFSKNKINITSHDKNNLVFGYSYFPQNKLLDNLVDEFNKIILNYKYFQNRLTEDGNGFISEMKMLSIVSKKNPGLFYFLESLPYSNKKYLFDPAGYGQFLDGTHRKRGNYIFKRRWIGLHTDVGKELKSKRIKVIFKNNRPYIIYNNKKFKLASLHIHSKRLWKFLPSNYSSII